MRAEAIDMDAGTLGCGQVFDAPPTHLQQYERNEQYPQSELRLVRGDLSVMHINEIGEPGDGSPCLLRVPRPVMAPCLLCPQGAEEHADGNQRYADNDEIV